MATSYEDKNIDTKEAEVSNLKTGIVEDGKESDSDGNN